MSADCLATHERTGAAEPCQCLQPTGHAGEHVCETCHCGWWRVTHEAKVDSTIGFHRATCTCGWTDAVRGQWLDAARAAKQHTQDVDATVASG